MASRIRTITFDCREPFRLARFWAEVLGYVDDPDNPNAPGDPEAFLAPPGRVGPALLFLPVPEAKATKNRVHLDLQPAEGRDLEVERIVALGGSVVADHRRDDGSGWVVIADPEGNEACVERSAAERGLVADRHVERPFPREMMAADERVMLETMLDWYRAGVVSKVQGMDHALAVATPLRSPTSVAGLVKHLALVEDSWFANDLVGEPEADWYRDVDWDADRDWEFHTVAEEPLELQVERYVAACERARAIAAALPLDHASVTSRGTPFTLRYVLVHLIEETARHLGHLDVLRELLDGTTGE